MASSKSRTRSVHHGKGVSVSSVAIGEAHRRTCSVKRPPSVTDQSLPTNTHYKQGNNGEQSDRFQAWRFPLAVSTSSNEDGSSEGENTHSSGSSSHSSPDTSVEYSPNVRISSLQHDANDVKPNKMVSIAEDSYSSADDTPVRHTSHRTRHSIFGNRQAHYSSNMRTGHRTSPSLPYPAMSSTSFTNLHPATSHSSRPFYRATAQSTLVSWSRMVYLSLRRMHIAELVFTLFFFFCVCIFMGALTGVGYSENNNKVGQEAIALPPAQILANSLLAPLPALIPTDEQRQPDAVANAEATQSEKLRTHVVKPLRESLQGNKPLAIVEDSENADEALPAWAKQRFERIQPAADLTSDEIIEGERLQLSSVDDSRVDFEDLDSDQGFDQEVAVDYDPIDADDSDVEEVGDEAEVVDEESFAKGTPEDWHDRRLDRHLPNSNIFDKAAVELLEHVSHTDQLPEERFEDDLPFNSADFEATPEEVAKTLNAADSQLDPLQRRQWADKALPQRIARVRRR